MAKRRRNWDDDEIPSGSQNQWMLWLIGGGVATAVLLLGIGTLVILATWKPAQAPFNPGPPPNVQPVVKPDPINRLATLRWSQHFEAASDYKIDLPGEPRSTLMSRNGQLFDPNGIPIRSVVFLDSDLELGMFNHAITPNDRRSFQQFYDEHQPIYPAVGNAVGRIIEETKVVVDGNVGREFIIQADKQKVLYRVFKGKKWAHVVFAMGTRTEDSRAIIERFFSSLRILDPAQEPADVAADPGDNKKK